MNKIYLLIVGIFIFNVYAHASSSAVVANISSKKLKSLADLHAESSKLKSQAKHEELYNKKLEKLNALKGILDEELRVYRKKYPRQGSSEEEKIWFFYFVMEPVFEAANHIKPLDTENCERTRHKIDIVTNAGKDMDSVSFKGRTESLIWLAVLCPSRASGK